MHMEEKKLHEIIPDQIEDKVTKEKEKKQKIRIYFTV